MARTLRPVLVFVAALWMLEIVDALLLGGGLDGLGIRPRTLRGLLGIPLAPLLHGGFGHLLANTLPLLVLGGLSCARRRADWVETTVAVTLFGGAFVWIFGSGASLHLGSSILVFGYAGELVARGAVGRRPLDLVVALLVLLFYGGALLRGLLPEPGISLVGHLGGLCAGALVGVVEARGAGASAS